MSCIALVKESLTINMSLRYNDLISVLTKAIQEQQTQIEALKTK